MKSLLLSLALLLAVTPALARTEVCRSVREQDIAHLFERWNASLKSGVPAEVVANYAERSVLLPTLSDTPRLTPEAKADYFEHFLARQPSGTIDQRHIELGCNSAVDSGRYSFRFGDGSIAQARFTFTYAWNGKEWLITSHHSSLLPGKP